MKVLDILQNVCINICMSLEQGEQALQIRYIKATLPITDENPPHFCNFSSLLCERSFLFWGVNDMKLRSV